VVGYSVLMTSGLAFWCIPTASLMDVKDWEYDGGGVLLALAGSVQLLWLLIALVVLPLEQGARKTSTTAATTGPGRDRIVPVTDAGSGPAVDSGSVPAAARASRVVLTAPVASRKPRA
jgi:hypothetical protein